MRTGKCYSNKQFFIRIGSMVMVIILLHENENVKYVSPTGIHESKQKLRQSTHDPRLNVKDINVNCNKSKKKWSIYIYVYIYIYLKSKLLANYISTFCSINITLACFLFLLIVTVCFSRILLSHLINNLCNSI